MPGTLVTQLGLIGCGLMGGSFALALKRLGKVQRVVGFSRSPQSALNAQRLGVIDEAVASAQKAAQGSDLVLLAVPVSATESTLRAIAPHLLPEALCMDVGSTKRDVVMAASKALGHRVSQFVPAHPIAGKERSGVDHADPALYDGRTVILTPRPQTAPEALERAASLWSALGSRVVRMSADAHDEAFAAVSHLPHLLAFAYINAIADQPAAGRWLELAGPGFRDFTRIAASDAALWRDVLLANQDHVLKQARSFSEALLHLEHALQRHDHAALLALMEQASQVRSAWPGKS